ncbi:hypothetical protein AMECASPLE_038016 [Ameca splendens]|uniref:Uncharacterized protein n=1 Tax=Ameca splendens TaxID=208324 RepID=A0ABV1AEG4_9TELE
MRTVAVAGSCRGNLSSILTLSEQRMAHPPCLVSPAWVPVPLISCSPSINWLQRLVAFGYECLIMQGEDGCVAELQPHTHPLSNESHRRCSWLCLQQVTPTQEHH